MECRDTHLTTTTTSTCSLHTYTHNTTNRFCVPFGNVLAACEVLDGVVGVDHLAPLRVLLSHRTGGGHVDAVDAPPLATVLAAQPERQDLLGEEHLHGGVKATVGIPPALPLDVRAHCHGTGGNRQDAHTHTGVHMPSLTGVQQNCAPHTRVNLLSDGFHWISGTVHWCTEPRLKELRE